MKKNPEGAVNVPSFESADPEFNSTLLNGTIVFSILKFVSMLATNAESIGQTGSNEVNTDLAQLIISTDKFWWSNDIWNIDFALIFTDKGFQIKVN